MFGGEQHDVYGERPARSERSVVNADAMQRLALDRRMRLRVRKSGAEYDIQHPVFFRE